MVFFRTEEFSFDFLFAQAPCRFLRIGAERNGQVAQVNGVNTPFTGSTLPFGNRSGSPGREPDQLREPEVNGTENPGPQNWSAADH